VGRALGSVVALLLAFPAAGGAQVRVVINPASSSSEIYEEERLNLTAYPDAETARVVIAFGAAGGPCAAEPGADPRPVVADGTADIGLDATATAPDHGAYRACAWEYGPDGAVRGRGDTVAEVAQQFAEASLSAFPVRVWPGIPVDVFSSALGKRGRVLQTTLQSTACPASAPGPAGAARHLSRVQLDRRGRWRSLPRGAGRDHLHGGAGPGPYRDRALGEP